MVGGSRWGRHIQIKQRLNKGRETPSVTLRGLSPHQICREWPQGGQIEGKVEVSRPRNMALHIRQLVVSKQHAIEIRGKITDENFDAPQS